MTREWIEPIFDRTYGSVQDVQYNPDQENPKGAWNAVDLNRIEHNTAYCAEWMLKQKIVRIPPEISVREDNYWTSDMIPTKTEIDRILNNVRLLVELSSSNPAIADQLPNIYAATQINYVLANQIEFALDLMHDQPKLPLDYWALKINYGIITQIVRDGGEVEIVKASEALVAEDEVVTILGTEYGDYAQFQDFKYWSGQTDDIDLLENYQAKQTTFTMPYRDVEFTAVFETHIPRTLTLTNGYISAKNDPTAESGPNTGTYLAGDQVMIIANRAASGKAFYEWTGTEEALEQIVGITSDEDPSTAILTMPDCDVILEPFYINAGQHSVTVTNGTGGGWYNYKDYVSISASVPDHYGFDNWSGNTSYLSDIYSSYQSFRMGDENISFRAHYSYRYSYNDVQVIDGLIRVNNEELSTAANLREKSSQTLIPTPLNSTQGLDYWEIEGEGYIVTDLVGNHTNTFVVGDGNAIITGHYNTLQNLILRNINNNGESVSSQVVQGHKVRITTNLLSGNYIFDNWTVNGEIVSTSIEYIFTMPTETKVVQANYRERNRVKITIDYGDYKEIVEMLERESKTITATGEILEAEFYRWTHSNLYDITNIYSPTTTITAGNINGTVTATYKNLHTLIVNAGSGSGRIKEGYTTTIEATQAPDTYEFSHWEINAGDGTIANIYSKKTEFKMGTTDAEITALYTPMPYFTVTMENGYIQNTDGDWVESVTLLRDSTNAIQMKPAPTGHQFLRWEIYVDGVLQTGEDANDVYEPLAETTRLRKLLRNVTLKATYYIPDPTVTYTLTIERKDGSVDQRDYPAGTDVTIRASYPDEGMEFYKWTGDTAYVAGGIYKSESYVRMPAQNISIKENYVPEGYIPVYDLVMTNIYGECCYTTEYTDPDTGETTVTENWVTRHEYEEGTEVKIRTTAIPNEYYFSTWTAKDHDTEEDARPIIDELNEATTTLTMPGYDVDIEPSIGPKTTYKLTVNNGGTSGFYYEGARADIYFSMEDTTDVHYEFIRWTGSTITKLELYEGGMFNVTTPGDSNNPQFIKMPAEATEITATYKTKYRLTINGGIIDKEETNQGYYETGITLTITADKAPSGMKFQYWEGDTDVLSSKYDATPTLKTVTGTTTLTAIYSTDTNRNSIGYVETSLKDVSAISNADINIISGVIEIGFIITDSIGHIYIITSINDEIDTSTIYRMTKTVQGGNVYG